MVKKLKIKRGHFIQAIALIIVLLVSFLVGTRYIRSAFFLLVEKHDEFKIRMQLTKRRINFECEAGSVEVKIKGGKVCSTLNQSSSYQEIFKKYPIESRGKEQIYRVLEKGTIDNADKLLENTYVIERYEPVSMVGLPTWEEDPYKEKYWRFLFYGFRPVRHLFFAYNTTHDQKYLIKTKQLTDSFLDVGINKKNSWQDFHAVSFRTMFLVKTWWQLRSANLLDNEFSDKLLRSIEVHSEFLADPNHYDKGYNHGLNEAAALYLVAVNFPDLENSDVWLNISKNRISEGLVNVVDEDGVLKENSPYYHFYALEKYWELYEYSVKWKRVISDNFDERIEKMVFYAANVLQPNGRIPLQGASIDREIFRNGIYKEISNKFPEFEYVTSQGVYGNKPNKKVTVYPKSGQVIFRSDWGNKENFKEQTQIIFDAGPYRTLHSNLDALSFSLYDSGINLMPDSGLFTYNEGRMKDYFEGTVAHNTVVVDDMDQKVGTAVLGEVIEKNNFVSMSGMHELYKGVTHMRSIIYLKEKYVVIFDKLLSKESHNYKLYYHLFPGLEIEQNGLNLKVFSEDKREVMNIYQLEMAGMGLKTYIGDTQKPIGLCSLEYGKHLPCWALEYEKTGENVEFVTLIELENHSDKLSYEKKDRVLKIADEEKNFEIDLNQTQKKPEEVKINNKNTYKLDDKKSQNLLEKELIINTPKSGTTERIDLPLKLNLSKKNLIIKAKTVNRADLDVIDLSLTGNSWRGSAKINLKNALYDLYEDEWVNISLAKGSLRDFGGEWEITGNGFDWSDIKQIRFDVSSDKFTSSSLAISDISTIPERSEGEIIIIFDDGYESIIPAIIEMNKRGFAGSVAVIADRVENGQRGYLSLSQLKEIKDKYGWDIVNHSQHHLHAVDNYFENKQLDELEADIISGAKFLSQNNLNTAPNWYVYPNGATNADVKKIVGKYYLFARTTNNNPESYPFGEPLGVKVISADSVYDDQKNFTSSESLKKAVLDAKSFKYPLFITFHRIKSKESDRPGYDINEFIKLLDYIGQQGVNVKTLRQFDKDNGFEQLEFRFVDGVPSQITSAVKVKYNYGNIIWNKFIGLTDLLHRE